MPAFLDSGLGRRLAAPVSVLSNYLGRGRPGGRSVLRYCEAVAANCKGTMRRPAGWGLWPHLPRNYRLSSSASHRRLRYDRNPDRRRLASRPHGRRRRLSI